MRDEIDLESDSSDSHAFSENLLAGIPEQTLNRYRNPDGTYNRPVKKILEEVRFWDTKTYDPHRIDPDHWDGRLKSKGNV